MTSASLSIPKSSNYKKHPIWFPLENCRGISFSVPIGGSPFLFPSQVNREGREYSRCGGFRYLTGKVVPGTRVVATGIYSTYTPGGGRKSKGAVAVVNPYLRVLGLEIDTDGTGRGTRNFTAEEETEFAEMAKTENFYERFSASIAPSIFGNDGPFSFNLTRSPLFFSDTITTRADIKKATACLLFGGSKKILPDGMRLRGDINVLLLGDPGTAKSQLLKFVEKVSPISVYTSGKGSSAAGLTASVQRDPQSVRLAIFRIRKLGLCTNGSFGDD